MIKPTISMKLDGTHLKAFQAFAIRSGATTSRTNVKSLIETLPEYKNLTNVRDDANSSVCNSGSTIGG